jgi:thiamine kinase-like enzyme
MFRDFKSGGYNLEETNVSGERFITLVILIAIAYTSATIQGQEIKRKGIQKYVGRIKEYGRTERRHSSFYIGLYGNNWVNFMESCIELVSKLMKLNRNKRKYYQRGLRAMRLILSAS